MKKLGCHSKCKVTWIPRNCTKLAVLPIARSTVKPNNLKEGGFKHLNIAFSKNAELQMGFHIFFTFYHESHIGSVKCKTTKTKTKSSHIFNNN